MWAKKPLCPFCSAEWTDDMLRVEASASGGCPTCGYGSVAYKSIKIVCHSCHRLIYEKEYEERLV